MPSPSSGSITAGSNETIEFTDDVDNFVLLSKVAFHSVLFGSPVSLKVVVLFLIQ